MDKMPEFLEEGDDCSVFECSGTMEYPPVEDCSCHISPPCFNCVENQLVCNKCGLTGEEY